MSKKIPIILCNFKHLPGGPSMMPVGNCPSLFIVVVNPRSPLSPFSPLSPIKRIFVLIKRGREKEERISHLLDPSHQHRLFHLEVCFKIKFYSLEKNYSRFMHTLVVWKKCIKKYVNDKILGNIRRKTHPGSPLVPASPIKIELQKNSLISTIISFLPNSLNESQKSSTNKEKNQKNSLFRSIAKNQNFQV